MGQHRKRFSSRHRRAPHIIRGIMMKISLKPIKTEDDYETPSRQQKRSSTPKKVHSKLISATSSANSYQTMKTNTTQSTFVTHLMTHLER